MSDIRGKRKKGGNFMRGYTSDENEEYTDCESSFGTIIISFLSNYFPLFIFYYASGEIFAVK